MRRQDDCSEFMHCLFAEITNTVHENADNFLRVLSKRIFIKSMQLSYFGYVSRASDAAVLLEAGPLGFPPMVVRRAGYSPVRGVYVLLLFTFLGGTQQAFNAGLVRLQRDPSCEMAKFLIYWEVNSRVATSAGESRSKSNRTQRSATLSMGE